MDTQDEYFTSYEDIEVHRLMLEDAPRTTAYQKAILGNQNYFKGKVVMDVGCGTGILSIFCAQAGAKQVYAVEASNVAKIAMKVVKENNFEHVIEVLHSRVEDVVLPNNIKVDAIVSEWMGFFLLHEGMLDSVLFARHKFLKEDGEMFPENAAIYVAPCSINSFYGKYDNLYGVSMSSFATELRVGKSQKPEIMTIGADELFGEKLTMAWINLKEDMPEDLNSFTIEYCGGASKEGKFHGICLWFECTFPELSSEVAKVVLNTGPTSPETHWKQTIIVLPGEVEVEADEPIAFLLKINRDQCNGRRYDLDLTMQDPSVVEHPIPCTCDLTKCILMKSFMRQTEELGLLNSPVGPTTIVIDDDDED